MQLIEAIVLAIVEGITEFLPVSSTGHMIIASALMGMESTEFLKIFIVSIQFGTILSVVALYWKRFFRSFDFYFKLLVGFLPAVFVGLLLKKQIDALLDNVVVVGFTLLIGGILLLFVDKWFKNNDSDEPNIDTMPYKTAFLIGCFQVVAMVPGVSRSAATIIGGLTQKLSFKNAAEFSFFLAVPTMFAASAKDLLDGHRLIESQHIWLLLVGNAVGFLVAVVFIKLFLGILNRYGFKPFGYYRIVVGSVILLLYYLGYNLNMVD